MILVDLRVEGFGHEWPLTRLDRRKYKKNGEKREIIQSVFIRVHRMRHLCHPWFERHSEEDTRE